MPAVVGQASNAVGGVCRIWHHCINECSGGEGASTRIRSQRAALPLGAKISRQRGCIRWERGGGSSGATRRVLGKGPREMVDSEGLGTPIGDTTPPLHRRVLHALRVELMHGELHHGCSHGGMAYALGPASEPAVTYRGAWGGVGGEGVA
ncbi:hypothetical protein AMTR_s00039p00075940 [Amborella trichopoda]|uniref:Uncharacterized protein n=1 Tax=Amborella trichopoda TaxID=13333 RepID=U5D0I0_AMBTC|nr:hypothetical protein AMTR_s00039p00075940 [Amborella trichopoda]